MFFKASYTTWYTFSPPSLSLHPSVVTTMASSAFLNGLTSLVESILSLFFILSSTSSYEVFIPFSAFCFTLLFALSSALHSKNIFTSAFGKIVVPISLPYIITFFPSANLL